MITERGAVGSVSVKDKDKEKTLSRFIKGGDGRKCSMLPSVMAQGAKRQDDLDAFIAERQAKNAEFTGLMEAAARTRKRVKRKVGQGKQIRD
jgi:F0F1-type ATP synthase epsilon subunit